MEPTFKKGLEILRCSPIDPANLPYKTLSRLHPDGVINCCKCGCSATHVVTWKHENENYWHIDYFAQRPDGSMKMMTKDHILPKSLGGTNQLTNLRAMCRTCNGNRGNTVTNREMIEMCANAKSHTSHYHMRKMGMRQFTQPHPLAGWLAIFQRFPELENAVRFE